MNLVANLDEPSRGNINFGTGQTQVKLSMVFQQPRLLDWLTVSENIDLIFDTVSPGESLNSQELILELLNKVGLNDQVDSYPQFLSGGQKQRVAIARAFAIHPEVLLLDEPFSALDELTARRLRLLLQSLWLDEDNHRPTSILVTHNMLEAAFLADRIFIMAGSPAKISSIIDVDIPRPRNPDDPKLFEIHRAIMSALN